MANRAESSGSFCTRDQGFLSKASIDEKCGEYVATSMGMIGRGVWLGVCVLG